MSKHSDQAKRIFGGIKVDREGSLAEAFETFRRVGWEVKHEYAMHSLYDAILQHPYAALVNSQHRSDYARDMCHMFFDLYEVVEDLDVPDFYICIGRIGNTVDYTLQPPKEYVDERPPSTQMLLPLEG